MNEEEALREASTVQLSYRPEQNSMAGMKQPLPFPLDLTYVRNTCPRPSPLYHLD
jgi:hypothetical protein